MNIKIRNLIIYAIFIVILFLSLLTPFVDESSLWKPENNISGDFHGISFDNPANISKLNISRSKKEIKNMDLITYNVQFEYNGRPSNMRIIGKLAEQAFFAEVPSYSKVVMEGDFDAINQSLFEERLELKDYYKKVDNYKFDSKSEIRVPLNEDTKNYNFTLSYRPRELVYKEDYKISDLAVFLTNARVDSFTDKETSADTLTQSFVESGMYVNQYEGLTDNTVGRLEKIKNINIAIFLLSLVLMVLVIWFNKTENQFISMALILANILTFYRFIGQDISTKGILLIFPIFGILLVIASNLMSREELRLNKYDFSQSLLGIVIVTILGLLVYVIPTTL